MRAPVRWLSILGPYARFVRYAPLAPLGVLFALLAAVGLVQPTFLSTNNLGMLAGESSVILLFATGQTLVILLGGIDLSMAALAALASVLIALSLPTLGGAGVLGVLALSTVVGAFQGYVHVRAQLPSVVVTLAGLGIWSGLALAIAHTTLPVQTGEAAVAWLEGSSFGVSHAFAFAVAALIVLCACLRWLPLGRYVYAIGLNPRVALLSGIRVGRVKVLAFALAGLFSGLAGLAMVARTSSASPTIADSLLLPSIAAVLIGGTAITGGVGGLGRTLIGVLTVTVLRVGIAATGVDPAYEPIAYGVLVVVAAALSADRSMGRVAEAR
ncbi:ABC transporter permease [Aquabacterium sp.]|uniref:ABC transporter permease n=1 Tax=Aquabacterium sp. TaxID=1872578 RepID=UPI002BC4DD69|nr:ABC transporter permease [Aquabacterium sp.]HSW07197.1 ABC transporter permease [Aquabacterium sp.]